MNTPFGRKTAAEDEPATPAPPPAPERGDIDYGKVAMVFIAFGLLSLLTALVLSSQLESLFDSWVERMPISAEEAAKDADPIEPGEQFPARTYATIGPISIRKAGVVLGIGVQANLPTNSWNFIETEVLDADKDYLFSFGNELWHEDGRDDEGYWNEADNGYSTKITIPTPGIYYFALKTQGDQTPGAIHVTIGRSVGSSIPHMLFGFITLIIGLLINEFANGTITGIMRKFK